MVSTTYSEATALCIRSMDLMTEGTREDFEPVYHPEGVNREAAVEPPATRQPGPAGFWATAQWLREAFSGLRFEIHEAVERDDLVVLHVTMSGRHTGDFVNFRPGTAIVDSVMPPTGKAFAVTQTHWFRTRDGVITEHWANRDDPGHGQAGRLGTPVARLPPARRDRQAPRPTALERTTGRTGSGIPRRQPRRTGQPRTHWIPGSTASERAGSGVSWRSNWRGACQP